MNKVDVRAVIKYSCKKGMSPKEIHMTSLKLFAHESPSYSSPKKWAAEFRKVRESVDDY